MAKEKIVVVEDEADIQELVKYNLSKEGYQITCYASGEDCLKSAVAVRPDLIVLDIMLPGVDGFEVCRELRRDSRTQHIPVIILTAKGEDADIVTGLELGADDYITKPFSPKVLIARVRNLLRRKRALESERKGALQLHGIVVDPARRQVHLDGKEVVLTNTEFLLLQLLIQSAGQVFTRDQIVKKVHGDDYPVTARSVDVQVVNLRKKLGEHGKHIETIRSVGYRFKE
jgi:two-component system, OmpR family, alkaline phosphatase synthesis response regulator PhoP